MRNLPSLPGLLAITLLPFAAAGASPDVTKLKVAPGYAIELFQADVKGARSLDHGPDGTVFVGTRGKSVYAIRAGKLVEIAKDLDTPNGIAFRDGDLFVGETKRIIKYPKIEAALAKGEVPKAVVVYTGLPEDGGHDWRYMRFGPDGALYVSLGAPCNICNREKDEPKYSTIVRFRKLDGSAPEIYARGVRNSVGFDWQPKSAALYFTENGRDWLGDDAPDDELNVVTKSGTHFGFPYCHAGTIPDPKLAETRKCEEFAAPTAKLGPHVAALGMRFIDPNRILIALHGSWNRSTPSGYRVMLYTFGATGKPTYEPFVDGFRTADGKVLGRPVDVDVQADGSFLVSDDQADAVYRIKKVEAASAK